MTLAVVTGASSGIGAAVARHLTDRGLIVLGVARRAAELHKVGTDIQGSGSFEPVVADLTTEAGIAAVAAAVAGRPVTALVHCAGIDHVREIATTTRAELDALWNINISAPILLTRTLLDVLADGAGVVFIGSTAATRGIDRHAAYGASKAALLGLTVNMAVDLAPRVRVNCVSPGGTRTPMTAGYLAAYRQGADPERVGRELAVESGRMLLGGLTEPKDVALTVGHVALDATAMTGTVIYIDGGFTAR
ncbi:SDR family NAD(P)-dependent oxidoreductase [Nonomuraea aurantiaca]|uniref:SDR family NAD(P)-dependent oxidoreductase n=1 Tax=Nonomuraea aurantiaca TaxID=2878562 RepID=UPI001CD99A23|nr:SDR family oxidoreductase [Nonomuraea aurantiaca]MCA2229588.1 SDR family oxidoreductase [Nonomuraea aurantiaca]